MESTIEQRYAIKFCVRLGKNATETFSMLQDAFKDNCLSYSQVKKWHKAFKEGPEEVADEPRSGRPSTSRIDENVQRVRDFLNSDRRFSVYQVADALNIPKSTVHRIISEDLLMRKVSAKLVPRVLTDDQKQLRVLRCKELLQLCEDDPEFLSKVVTGDETWCFEYIAGTTRRQKGRALSGTPPRHPGRRKLE
ncbi:PREDICTED: putative uncharacterized protein FLJ37770 [Vollenhovia emeryi]|uniref:putative uncharacterized protein FLJ37770 n=1 Tax=Vollenhovia emeryi TaxID=411798 RepID=UPI0005F3A482|nr:PREDICTED: putative uncharacterized protein FLJ37770 [Vollenhovia emeryi]